MRLVEGSITLRGSLVPARLRVMQWKSKYSAGEDRRYCVIRLGMKPHASVQLDWDPTSEELGTLWYPIRPKWAGEGQKGIDVQAVELPADEDADEREPHYISDSELKWIKQYSKPLWLFGMGTWSDDGGNSDAFLVLDCLDENEAAGSRKYKRLGLGSQRTEPSKPSIIRNVDGPQVIDLL